MSLERFKVAQDSPYDGFDSALRQLRAGRKTGHWIWYVFPQIEGLGMSDTAQLYAIRGSDEAAEYLDDAELRARLLTALTVVADHLKSGKVTLRALMASDIDAKKFVSSLTLFGFVAEELAKTEGREDIASLATLAKEALAITAEQGYPPCRYTLKRLQ